MNKSQLLVLEQKKREASETFNALPIEQRLILVPLLRVDQLRDLKIERNRAISAHHKHLKEIDSHIRNIEYSIIKNN